MCNGHLALRWVTHTSQIDNFTHIHTHAHTWFLFGEGLQPIAISCTRGKNSELVDVTGGLKVNSS
jgi:hypothetical protein